MVFSWSFNKALILEQKIGILCNFFGFFLNPIGVVLTPLISIFSVVFEGVPKLVIFWISLWVTVSFNHYWTRHKSMLLHPLTFLNAHKTYPLRLLDRAQPLIFKTFNLLFSLFKNWVFGDGCLIFRIEFGVLQVFKLAPWAIDIQKLPLRLTIFHKLLFRFGHVLFNFKALSWLNLDFRICNWIRDLGV